MLEGVFRPWYQRIFVDPIVRCIGHRISPIVITYSAAIFGLLFIPAILWVSPIVAIFLLLISGYCDTMDGSLARFQNTASPLGTVADILVDRLVEFSIIFGLYLVAPQSRALVTILMLGSILLCITTFLVLGIFMPNSSQKSFHYSPGLMERAEAFLFFIAMALFPSHFNSLGLLFAGLVALTAFIRLGQFSQLET